MIYFYECFIVWPCRSRRNLCTSLQQQAKYRHDFLQVDVREAHTFELRSLPLCLPLIKFDEI